MPADMCWAGTSNRSPLISTELSSPVHQHAFSFRLDWDLDGGDNSLFESEIEVLPIDDVIKDQVMERVNSTVIKRESIDRGCRTLRMDGAKKVLNGVNLDQPGR